jgi:O-acetylhomoserine (thiol)-lyase
MSAQTAQYQSQGLDMLKIRVERCYKNCLALAVFLNEHKKIKSVSYSGLKSDTQYDLALKYFNAIPGTILTFDLKSQKNCFLFMNKLQIIRRATNLNDNKSLIIHPYSTIYSEFSVEKRKKMGIRDTMMRLSVGIENTVDIIQDIKQAF